MKYDFAAVEKKWQDIWEEKGCFHATIDYSKPKFYGLVEFPYPSGQGLHVGHPRSYTAIDAICRQKRLQGYNVLYPMGWDAFGLPTENYAIANKMKPAVVTQRNVARFKSQLQALGLSFDWSREINTTDPNYYKWTQWIFLKFFEKGLAYKKEMSVNWCPSCKVVLANEEATGGVCERCGAPTTQKTKSQWMLAITKYAQRLIDDLDDLDFIERVTIQQKNWIGRSEGADVRFETTAGDVLEVYTTRPDTLFGATYMVIAPEHPLIEKWASHITNMDALLQYRTDAARKSDFERTEMVKEKTGVCIEGVRAINPVTGDEIPIYISDYVLMSYGTGAIMAVPAHDERDYDFAKVFHLPIVEVVKGGDIEKEAFTDCETGVMVNSGFLNGMTVEQAKQAIKKWLSDNGKGEPKVNYKLRDWIFSRQRYWGEPIPLVYCEKCGWVPVPYEQLPVLLPDVDSYEPTEDGDSPLAKIPEFVNTTCPHCGGPAKRETDTMPNWAGSSWYFLRYLDPHNDKELASREALDYWLPVDWYNGGMEHTTLHLLYSRFWHKFLYDCGVVPTKEPYQKRTSHGMILGENGEKMSKSRGNVINPDDIIAEYGADTMRLYEMFIGDFEKSAPWSTTGIKGCKRFLERTADLPGMMTREEGYSADMEVKTHALIKKVTYDIANLKGNTAIAALMSYLNDIEQKGSITAGELKAFLLLLNPMAPHLTEELWQQCGFGGMIVDQSWPSYDEAKTVESSVEIPVQVSGKLRGTIVIERGEAQASVVEKAKAKVAGYLEGKTVVKEIYVPDKLVNLVAK
ncbi:MAG TPA: leucine--tRNA ligase [Candidatus Galloscillospira excrementipullorum]|nr:leucine--tRNA ligase [Candidatus Galloscillospira excrementipullorum]